jgi:hypothetical protein
MTRVVSVTSPRISPRPRSTNRRPHASLNWHTFADGAAFPLDALSCFGHEGSSCRLTLEQQAALQNWVTVRLPRSTRTIGAWLEKNHGFNYSRPGLIALLHRLGFDYRKPHKMPRGLNDVRQQAFIASYEKLLNTMAADEAVVFVDAVHPTHQVRAAGCWAPKDTAIAVEQTTGRQNLNIHGAVNLETGQTQMLEVTKINAIVIGRI